MLWWTKILYVMQGSKGQNAVHACMTRHLNLGAAKHEEVQELPASKSASQIGRQVGNQFALQIGYIFRMFAGLREL